MFDERGKIAPDRGLLAARADELDRYIQRLMVVRDVLRHYEMITPEPEHLQCPKFRKILQQGEF